ncbi:MAG TPA: hypothetical protein VF963_08375 [Gaiellaceae bacterium]
MAIRALNIGDVVPTLSLVIPHWPLDEETDEALPLRRVIPRRV